MWRRKSAQEDVAEELVKRYAPRALSQMEEQEAHLRMRLGPGVGKSVPVKEYVAENRDEIVEDVIRRATELPNMIDELLALSRGVLKELAAENALTPEAMDEVDKMLDAILAEL